MDNPKVSYVVASYNHEAYLDEALRSILDQDFRDLELIVIDDGSTDGSARIAAAVAASDPRARVIVQENRGVVEARNRGIGISRGEFVSIVDSDDFMPPERTALLVQALEAHPNAALAYGDAWIIDAAGRRLGRFFENYPPLAGDFSVELFANYCFVPAPAVMFRRGALQASGPFWGPGPNTDYLKWIELGLLGEAICLRESRLGNWRWHGKNTSLAKGAGRALLYERLREGLEELARRHPELAERVGPRRLRRRYYQCHLIGGFYCAREGAWPEARAQFVKALHYHPSAFGAAAWLSALPGINIASQGIYALAERALLKVRP